MMSRTVRVALLLVLALTACHNKDQVQNQPALAPPIEDAPPPPPSNAPSNLPPPVITVPTQPAAQPDTKAQTTPPAPQPKPKKHKPKPVEQQQNSEVAQNDSAPKVNADGNFTPAEPADLRQETGSSIAQTEKGLNAITRKLSDQEQKTRAQIVEFLKQAKTALDSGDVDGARTLALKAKVLLNELVQ